MTIKAQKFIEYNEQLPDSFPDEFSDILLNSFQKCATVEDDEIPFFLQKLFQAGYIITPRPDKCLL